MSLGSPNGTQSPRNKTNPQLLDVNSAASLAPDQPTIVFMIDTVCLQEHTSLIHCEIYN